MQAIRYDSKKYEIGDYLPASRRWEDSNLTDDMLDGTSCIIIPQDKYTGHQYAAIYEYKYLVEGNYISDGEDDGEVILEDPEVVEIL